MTLRTAETYIIKSFEEFREELRVTPAELAAALPKQTKEKIIDAENEMRIGEGKAPVEDPTEAMESVILNTVEAHRGTELAILDVLEYRDQEYVHYDDSYSHMIFELVPAAEED